MTTKPTEGSEVQKELGVTFRSVRTKSGITLKTLAQRMDRSINTIRWHEAGCRSLRADELVMAAKIMKCSPTKLVPGPAPRKPRAPRVKVAAEPPQANGGEHDAASAS